MPILRTRVPIATVAELRLPRLQVELPAVRVMRAIAIVIKPKEGEDDE